MSIVPQKLSFWKNRISSLFSFFSFLHFSLSSKRNQDFRCFLNANRSFLSGQNSLWCARPFVVLKQSNSSIRFLSFLADTGQTWWSGADVIEVAFVTNQSRGGSPRWHEGRWVFSSGRRRGSCRMCMNMELLWPKCCRWLLVSPPWPRKKKT